MKRALLTSLFFMIVATTFAHSGHVHEGTLLEVLSHFFGTYYIHIIAIVAVAYGIYRKTTQNQTKDEREQ